MGGDHSCSNSTKLDYCPRWAVATAAAIAQSGYCPEMGGGTSWFRRRPPKNSTTATAERSSNESPQSYVKMVFIVASEASDLIFKIVIFHDVPPKVLNYIHSEEEGVGELEGVFVGRT